MPDPVVGDTGGLHGDIKWRAATSDPWSGPWGGGVQFIAHEIMLTGVYYDVRVEVSEGRYAEAVVRVLVGELYAEHQEGSVIFGSRQITNQEGTAVARAWARDHLEGTAVIQGVKAVHQEGTMVAAVRFHYHQEATAIVALSYLQHLEGTAVTYGMIQAGVLEVKIEHQSTRDLLASLGVTFE